MKDLFDAIPESVAPEPVLEGEAALEVIPPDDDEVIRPAAEEELTRLDDGGSLVEPGSSALAKHLLWTFGPYHADLPFMLQLRVEIEGERVVSVDPEVGWLHQGIEKALERASVAESFALVERLHIDNPVAPTLAWVLALERLHGVEPVVPERARLWRMIVAEVSRVAEHLAVLAPLARAHAGRRTDARFLDVQRRVRTLLELVAFPDGASVLHAVGGLAREPSTSVVDLLERALPEALTPLRGVEDVLAQNPTFVDALRGLGSITRATAVSYGLTGPLLRATGIADDVRVRHPYLAYDRVQPRVPERDGSDALARFLVRLDEIHAASAVTLRALAAYRAAPEGGLAAPFAPTTTSDTAAVSIEAPSGELSVLVVGDGAGGLCRARFHAPSFPLAATLRELLVGVRLDEVGSLLGGLGIVGTEVDR